VSGSVDSGRGGGPRLIVPAMTLILPVVLLIAALVMAQPGDRTAAAATIVVVTPTAVADAAAPDAHQPAPTLVEVSLEDEGDLIPDHAAPAVAVVITVVATPTAVPTPANTPTPQPTWGGPDTFTFVALGVDQRNTQEIPRTDTIMIGRVDLKSPRVSLVSVPRDLLVDIPGYGQDRINSAYVYGEQYKEPGGGIGLLQRTIEKNFGVNVDHFGMVDFQCFRTAVDAVGGVTVNVPRAIVDPQYPTEDYGTKLVKFEPGVQTMDGERALEYARTRHADNDFQRMQRQQLIVGAMREQFLQLRTLPAVPTLLGGCSNMRSDLGWRDYVTLATSLRTLDKSRITFAAIDDTMVADAVLSNGAAVLLPRWAPIRTLVSENLGPGAGSADTQVAPAASPPSVFPWPSPSPVSSPSPLGPGGSVAYPWPGDPLPDAVDMDTDAVMDAASPT
jgi:LCP family protein required for cell wall assembly